MQEGNPSRSHTADGIGDLGEDICLPKLKRKHLVYGEKFLLGNLKFPYKGEKSGAKLCLMSHPMLSQGHKGVHSRSTKVPLSLCPVS